MRRVAACHPTTSILQPPHLTSSKLNLRRHLLLLPGSLVLAAPATGATRAIPSILDPDFSAKRTSSGAQASVERTAMPGPPPTRKKIDSHLHVWASPEEAKRFPYAPGGEPTLPGHADFLLQEMAPAGVDGALIVQPINHKFDHSYVASVMRAHPDKFAGCCLADPTPGGGGLAEIERLVKEDGFRMTRFNPYLWAEGERMTNGVGREMFARAGELGVPVSFMCFKGLMLHIEDIEELAREYPDTAIVMDHFGFCKPPQTDSEARAWERLLRLADSPQVYVKASAFFRVSSEGPPYADTFSHLRALVDAFGAHRVMWGTDFPYVQEQCGYKGAWNLLPEAALEEAQSSDESAIMKVAPVLTSEEWLWVRGGTLSGLLAGAWKN